MRSVAGNRMSVISEGMSFDAAVAFSALSYEILINGILVKVEIEDPSRAKARQIQGQTNRPAAGVEVRSPMPGMVVRLEVREGSRVEEGEGLLILEAMKMENEIKARAAGTVKKISVSERQIVDKGQLLLVIQ